jgi:hypothetical protein
VAKVDVKLRSFAGRGREVYKDILTCSIGADNLQRVTPTIARGLEPSSIHGETSTETEVSRSDCPGRLCCVSQDGGRQCAGYVEGME